MDTNNIAMKLLDGLPNDILYIGIDEHTACIFNINESNLIVMGKGQAHFGSKSKIFSSPKKCVIKKLRLKKRRFTS